MPVSYTHLAKEKQELKVEDILEKFNAISIECGN